MNFDNFVQEIFDRSSTPNAEDPVDVSRAEFEHGSVLALETFLAAALASPLPAPGQPPNDAHFLASCFLQYVGLHKLLSTTATLGAVATVLLKTLDEKGDVRAQLEEIVQAHLNNARAVRHSLIGSVRRDMLSFTPEELDTWAPTLLALQGQVAMNAQMATERVNARLVASAAPSAEPPESAPLNPIPPPEDL